MFDSGTIIATVLGLIAFACFAALVKGAGLMTLAPPVTAKPLMTAMERRTIAYIETALPGTRIHAQVSMGAIVKPKKGLDRSKATTIRNRFSSNCIDYVVEDRSSGHIVMLIELDDRSHNEAADAKRDRMTAAAGYVTVRLPGHEKPTQESVDRHIRNAFAGNPQHQPTASRGRRRHAQLEGGTSWVSVTKK